MTNKIIDLADLLSKRQQPPAGVKALRSIDEETANEIISFILNMTLAEVRIGLGLEDIDENVDLKIFEKIDDLYNEAASDCYFCSKEIDPNEIQFSLETGLCMTCRFKLANFVQALGIDPGKVFKGMRTRRIQKDRIEY